MFCRLEFVILVYTVNQLLFAATLFCNLSNNWLAASNHRDGAFFMQIELHKTNWFVTRNIHEGEVLANVAKFSRPRVKVG
jgi:hypothetical protein